jgi:predicted component of type VI protein secretion system
MKRLLLAAAVVLAASGCSRNRESEPAGARIHDTTLTARDTTNPSDTLPRIRDTVPDSTRH